MTKSTIARERAQQIFLGNGPELSASEERELARMALAAMDSEPVGTLSVRAMSYSGKKIGTQFGFVHSDAAMKVPEGDYPLYRHAQQPIVPEERDKAVDSDDHPLLWSFNEGWNACLAAMLAAATQSPGSEPATVPGKWIPVSERMPEDRISVILWDAEIGEVTSGHYSHKTQTFYHCGDAIENEITHWMPPPCAPQEVK